MTNNEVLEAVKQVLLSDEFLVALAERLMMIEVEIHPGSPRDIMMPPTCKVTVKGKEIT
jgi:hypothetical protein